MTLYRFKAQALTPIHVGSGTEIDPLEFALQGKQLVSFNPAEVVDRLSPEERARFLQLLERADLKAIQAFLREHAELRREGAAPVDVSEGFRREFENRSGNPDRSFRVDMMPRNPHSGAVYLPGSSLKGAIRTALINHFANIDPQTTQDVHKKVRQAKADVERRVRKESDVARVLEEAALNRRQSETERDVFRMVDVEDAGIPVSSTRIDRAVNVNPFKPGSANIQMWVERLKSVADTWKAPTFTVNLHLDQLALQNRAVSALLGRTLNFDTLLTACNRLYWGRMQAEGNKFDGRKEGCAAWAALRGLFPMGRAPEPDAPTFTIDPGTPYWCYSGKKRVLLRVGRFSHFESLSADGLREGYNAQARKPIGDMGATRTRCVMENGKPAMPFGWLLLTLES